MTKYSYISNSGQIKEFPTVSNLAKIQLKEIEIRFLERYSC